MSVVAWFADEPDAAALGELPAGVRVVDEPGPDVQFVVPAWGRVPDLAALPSLAVVQVRSAGVDWIAADVPGGVTLCSARGARDAAMAEWVVAALLADRKRLGEFARDASWEPRAIGDLRGLRVLILGHGSIGRETERLLAPFGCEIVPVARRARAGVHAIEDVGTLVGSVDAVVNLLPLTDATHGLVDAALLGALADGTLYVNAGRGATTDTGALTAELERGRLRAVLDVVDPEPLPADHSLWRLPNVLISPHVAGDTPGGEREAWVFVGQQLRRYAAGEELVNVVRDGY